jgi:hypothetical protein
MPRVVTRSAHCLHSLAWAELYIATATIVRRFDFTFAPGMHENIEPYSDSFIITTKRQTGFEATVKEAV